MIKRHRLDRWIWADRLREQFVKSASNSHETSDPDALMYLSLWLTLLYSILESLEADEAQKFIKDIDDLYDTLREFRTVVFHVDYARPDFLYDAHVSEEIEKIHVEIGEYLHQIVTN